MFLFIVIVFTFFNFLPQMYNLFEVENLWGFNSFISFLKFSEYLQFKRKECKN